MLEFPEDMKCELEPWIPSYSVCVINLASQSEMTICQYQSDFKYIVRYLSCGNDRRKLDEYFQTTEFQLDHPEAFLDWLSAVTNDRRYRKAKELIETTEGKGGRINMCVLLDMYEERGMEKINSLYHCLLEDNRMEDIQKAMLDAAYQKELLREYGIGES